MHLFTLFRTFWGVFKKVEKIRLDIYLCFVFYSQPQYLKVSGCSGEVLDYSDHIEYQRWQTLFSENCSFKTFAPWRAQWVGYLLCNTYTLSISLFLSSRYLFLFIILHYLETA